ncbi:MAG: adaptor protein MecA [Oscillospiraceae bacterium]|jgi:hypothetical protein|nr:adaptor protein MecA [Oscillospiraceae bacterium]
MRIEAITRRKIIVELSAEDLSALDITYDALDYASVETRRVIWVILDRVRETTGCDVDPSGQMLIDAMPRPTGGCILFFTLHGGCAEPFSSGAPPRRTLRKREQLAAAYEFPALDALLDCAGAYARSFPDEAEQLIAQSELYRSGGKYRLLLCPAQEMNKVQRFFSEYGSLCGEEGIAACQTREHWQPFGGENAFARLGRRTHIEAGEQTGIRRLCPGSVYVSFGG